MSDDPTPVPQPGEADRDDNEIHYHEVDETNVGDAAQPEPPDDEDAPPDAAD